MAGQPIPANQAGDLATLLRGKTSLMPKQKPLPPEQPASPEYRRFPTADLRFDPENPRLKEYGISPSATQFDILKILWEQMAVEELAMSIAHNGYFSHEPLFIDESPTGPWVVFEGNRRLAAVKLLLSADYRSRLRATDLPNIDLIESKRRGELSSLPAIQTTRKKVWRYLGFKHVNGPSPWGAYAKAQYIATVHNDFKVPLKEIATQIGDYTNVVERLYHGLMVIEQAERAQVFDRKNVNRRNFEFSHLYEGLRREGIQKYLGLTKSSRVKKDPVPAGKVKHLGRLLEWIYGNHAKNIEPIMRTQAKDLNVLSSILLDPKGEKALRDGLSLQVAHDLSVGDTNLFKKALNEAKKHLQDSLGLLSTGFDPEDQTDLSTAADIEKLATDLVDGMRARQRKHKRTNRTENGHA